MPDFFSIKIHELFSDSRKMLEKFCIYMKESVKTFLYVPYNLMCSYVGHAPPLHKSSWNSVESFLCNPVNKQTKWKWKYNHGRGSNI